MNENEHREVQVIFTSMFNSVSHLLVAEQDDVRRRGVVRSVEEPLLRRQAAHTSRQHDPGPEMKLCTQVLSSICALFSESTSIEISRPRRTYTYST